VNSQNEDWSNHFADIPYVSDEDLLELDLLENLAEHIEGIKEYFYGNLFWSDPTDPQRDTACRAAARHMQYHSAMHIVEIKKIQKPRSKSYLKNLLRDVLESIPDVAETSEAFKNIKYEKSMAYFHAQQLLLGPNLIQSISLTRYEKWLGGLLTEDPNLYFQILNWHQQEELIRIQQDQLNANRQQNQLLRRANQIAIGQLNANQRLNQITKDQIVSSRLQAEKSAREAHDDSLRVQNNLSQIKREIE
jgi:hypothetical protein